MINDNHLWKRRFALLPHVCESTGAMIWFRFGYKFGDDFFPTAIWITEESYKILIRYQ